MRDIDSRDAGLGAGRCPSDEPTLMALRVPPRSKVLDLGCSTATMAPFLRSQGCYVVGLDNDAAALQLAKERCSAVVLADLNDPHALDGVDRDFDVILCNGMLGHVAEPNLLLTNLHNHVAETGCLIVSISDITHKGAPSVPRQAEGNDADRSSRDLTQRPFVTCEFVSRLFADTGWLITECEPAETPHDAETKVLGDAGSDALLGAADAELEDQLSRWVITAHRREASVIARLFERARHQWRVREKELNAANRSLQSQVAGLEAQVLALSCEQESWATRERQLQEANHDLSDMIAHLREELAVSSKSREAVLDQLNTLAREYKSLQALAEQYRYFYESLRFSLGGRAAHRLGTVKTALKTAKRLWGTPKQFAQMAQKASRVLVTEGPAKLAGYGIKKVREPHLRYNEEPRILNAEEDVEGYKVWLRSHAPSSEDLGRMAQRVNTWTVKPLLSVLMPVYNVDARWLEAAVNSVKRQCYPFWELLMVDDASTKPSTVHYLLELERDPDPRIRLTRRRSNGGISAATNDALQTAQGEFIALMDHDDELAPHALFRIVERIQQDPSADILYSDEDKIDEQGNRSAPFFKPTWSPTLLLGMNYISHLGVYRTSIARQVGGFRSEFDGAQDYDFLLRCTEVTQSIVHVPDVLYHWRSLAASAASSLDAKPYAVDCGRTAVQEYLGRQRLPGRVIPGNIPARYRVVWEWRPWPSVSVIIPTKNHVDLLSTCIQGLERAQYPATLEVVIVDNGSSDETAQRYLRESPHKVVSAAGPFNFSKLVNQGVAHSSGDVLLLLNNDIEMLDTQWLKDMVGQLLAPQVGVVGARLLYPDRRIQHAGIILGLGGIAGHAFHLNAADASGYFGLQQVSHEVSAVTGACLLTHRHLFLDVGGFREDFPVNFNDVAYCLDVQRRGYRVIYDADATLIHHESASRSSLVGPSDEQHFLESFEGVDRYYSPNLSLAPSQSYLLPVGDTAPMRTAAGTTHT